MKRNIAAIDQTKCDGCEICIWCCEEGALEISGGKAIMARDFACDGLGSCIGECPQNAITMAEIDCSPCDIAEIMQKIIHRGPKHIADYLKHLEKHRQHKLLDSAVDYLRTNNLPIPLKSYCKQSVKG